jgi:hypothetical protein
MTHIRYLIPEKNPSNSSKREAHLCCHSRVNQGSTIAAAHAANALPMLVTSDQFKSVAGSTERSKQACGLLKTGGTLPPIMAEMYRLDDFGDVNFEDVGSPSAREALTGQRKDHDHPHNWSNAASGRVGLLSACTVAST